MRVFMDRRGGREAFRYVLQSGRTATVHVDEIFDYHEDYLRDRILRKLTVSTSIDQLLSLLQILDCDVDFVVRAADRDARFIR